MNEKDNSFKGLVDSLRNEINKKGSVVAKLSMPHFLYQTTAQAKAYEEATHRSTAYLKTLDKPISKLIEDNIEGLCEDLSKEIHFIDLGPGYPSKSLQIIDEIIKQGNLVTYFPVDVSLFFLKRATAAIASRGIHYNSLQERFENLAPVLDRDLFLKEGMRYVFLGLTFNNFEPDYISKILSELTNPGDRCVICCQSPNGVDEYDLTLPYRTNSVDKFCFLPLDAVGLKRTDFDFLVVFEDNAIRVRYRATRELRVDDIVIPQGFLLETSASYRYELAHVKKSVELYFSVKEIYNSEHENIHLFSLQSE